MWTNTTVQPLALQINLLSPGPIHIDMSEQNNKTITVPYRYSTTRIICARLSVCTVLNLRRHIVAKISGLNWATARLGISLSLNSSQNLCMMTSSNENIFRVTGPLCAEFTGHRWIPLTTASDAELWCFLDLRLNRRLSKDSRGWWFETPSCSLWRQCNGLNRCWFINRATIHWAGGRLTGCKISWRRLKAARLDVTKIVSF